MKKSRRLIVGAVAVVLVATMFAVSAFAYLLGDVNGDGKIKANDGRLILRCAAGLDTLEGDAKLAADANQDGKIKANDARIVLRVAAGLDTMPATTEQPTSGGTAEPTTEKPVVTTTRITPTGPSVVVTTKAPVTVTTAPPTIVIGPDVTGGGQIDIGELG